MDYLQRVLEALRIQTLPAGQWELLLVDNASWEMPDGRLGMGWHPHARVVREGQLGLTFARLRGFVEARGELIVMVDDDNLLAPDYLEAAVRIAEEHPMLGAFGGKCLPEFEVEPPEWLVARGKGLGLRDRGEREEIFPEAAIAESRRLAVGSWQSGEDGQPSPRTVGKAEDSPRANRSPGDQLTLNTDDCRLRLTEFPDCAPIGAGMVLRSSAARAYAERLFRSSGLRVAGGGSAYAQINSGVTRPVITDRKGDSLASGGDNDICLTVIEEGWQVGYFPQLQLTHLIPERRMTLDYHRRMARDSMKSFILMLDQHGMRPWPAMPKWTLPLRVASDWLRVKPWRGPEQSLRWWNNVGMYEGRAALPRGGERAIGCGPRL